MELLGLPRDAAGRLVLVLAIVLALDLQAPWVAFDGTHISPARFSLPMLLVAGLLIAAAGSVIYAPFRQRPYYAAYPVVLGAAAFGAAATLTLMVGPFASPLSAAFVAHVLASPVVAQNLANPTPVSTPPTIELAADIGLYVFLGGSAIFTVAGYQLFVNAAVSSAVPAATAGQANPAATSPSAAPGRVEPAAFVSAGMSTPSDRGSLPPPPSRDQAGVVLPGSAGWDRPMDAPSRRNPPSSRSALGRR
jgi:hypothetical protein